MARDGVKLLDPSPTLWKKIITIWFAGKLCITSLNMTITYNYHRCPLVITHGLLENPPFTLIIVPIEKQKSQCSRISQRPAMFDYPKYHGGVYFITYPRFTRKIVGEIPILDWIMSPSFP
jgi:hypothetical protein